jgi:hypothetical protein
MATPLLITSAASAVPPRNFVFMYFLPLFATKDARFGRPIDDER